MLYSLGGLVTECFVHRDLSVRRELPGVFVECATLVGGFMIILSVALGFTNYLILAEVPSPGRKPGESVLRKLRAPPALGHPWRPSGAWSGPTVGRPRRAAFLINIPHGPRDFPAPT